MKQKTLLGTDVPTEELCVDCRHSYYKSTHSNRKFLKCPLKPRGYGYDLKKDQKCCPLWKPKYTCPFCGKPRQGGDICWECHQKADLDGEKLTFFKEERRDGA